jgi:hypothetical protein
LPAYDKYRGSGLGSQAESVGGVNDHAAPDLLQYAADQGRSQPMLTNRRCDLATRSRSMQSPKFDHANQLGTSSASAKATDSQPVDN